MKLQKYITILAALLISTILIEKNAQADYLPANQSAQEQVDSFDMVMAYLETPQFVPSRLEFRKLSPDAVADLTRVATSSRVKSAIRARAVQSLALYVDDERAVQTINELMEKSRPGQKIFPAVMVAFAQVNGAESAGKLVELAENRRKEVRVAAVIALGRFGGQPGYEALLRLKETEENANVLERIRFYTE